MANLAPLASAFDSEDRALAEKLFSSIRTLSAAREGVTRPAYSETETAAMQIIADAARQFGLSTRFDSAANLVVELPDAASGMPAYWVGSHLDSVAEGGNYDGLAGVVAGLLCLMKAKQTGGTLNRPLVLVGLRGEEAVWFGKTYLGSSSLLGKLDEADMERPHRETGRPLREYLEAVGADARRIAAGEPLVDAAQIGAWLELHIEQGPAMVRAGVPVGVVTGIRGSTRHLNAHCLGTAGHSGAVPRAARQDAVVALAHLITRLDDHWGRLEEGGADLVVTCGIVSTNPNEHAATRIPGDVRFSLDIRSKSTETVESFYQLFLDECHDSENSRGVKFELDQRVVVQPGAIDEEWASRLRDVSSRLGYGYMDILSGAGHDAAVFANAGVPAAMVFVRNEGGSHNPAERMDLDDFMKGVDVLYHALVGAAQG